MAEVKLGYGGRVLKTKNKDAYIGIHKEVAKMMKSKKIYIVFDIENNYFNFASEAECSTGEEPKFKNFKETIGKDLVASDGNTPIKSNNLYLKPFYIRMSNDAAKVFKGAKVFWAHGKINKSKEFNLDGDVKDFKGIREILGQGTVWCLCPQSMADRSLAVTNASDLADLTPEEQEKCKLYVSITKSELFPLNDIPYFKESCELALSQG